MLIGYFAVVYVPFVLAVGLAWFCIAATLGKTRGGEWGAAMRASIRSTLIVMGGLLGSLLFLGVMGVMAGF